MKQNSSHRSRVKEAGMKKKKGKWRLIQGTIFYRGLFWSIRKNDTPMRMMRTRFPMSKNKDQDFEHTCIINHAEEL